MNNPAVIGVPLIGAAANKHVAFVDGVSTVAGVTSSGIDLLF